MRTVAILTLLTLFSACKKNQEPEVAAEPEVKDPRSTVTINVRGPATSYERVRVTCKDLGPEVKLLGDLVSGQAAVTGLQGECKAQLMPGEVDLGTVTGGSVLDCIIQDDGSVGCKGGN